MAGRGSLGFAWAPFLGLWDAPPSPGCALVRSAQHLQSAVWLLAASHLWGPDQSHLAGTAAASSQRLHSVAVSAHQGS